jgi:hypothetical protein
MAAILEASICTGFSGLILQVTAFFDRQHVQGCEGGEVLQNFSYAIPLRKPINLHTRSSIGRLQMQPLNATAL